MAGKMDWLAYGLPVERPENAAATVLDNLDRNIPTAFFTETIGQVHLRLDDSSQSALLPVVNDRKVVLGVIKKPIHGMDPVMPVTEAMDPGPTTIRPYTPSQSVVERLIKENKDAILVTVPDGRLLGIFRRQFDSVKDRLPAGGIWD